MKYFFDDMGDPLFMAHMQAGMDARHLQDCGVPLSEAVAQTLERMRWLFGDDVPARLVYQAVRRAYRYRARGEVAK